MKSVTFENLKKQNYTMKESLRALKTNIQFCGDDICTIVVTSAMPNEGKSTVTMDLARSFSESGKRVLLIDFCRSVSTKPDRNSGKKVFYRVT